MADRQIKVLLVEENEDKFVTTRRLLDQITGASYQVERVSDFERGLRALASGQYDACLVDYRLGARDGIQFIKQAVVAACESPLILLADDPDHEIDLQAREAGASDTLAKSQVSSPLLERSIRYGMQQKRSADALR